MDNRSPVALADTTFGADTRAPVVRGDQAIFTSTRSPMGQGYRIVAMSPGIRPEERAEITRRSPSHDSLCDPDPAAVGLLSYRLSTDRQCVGYCCYAGREQSARGGLRVYSHMVLLNPADYLAFDNDAIRVHDVLFKAMGRQPVMKPSPCLDELSLPIDRMPVESADSFITPDHICAITSTLLAGHRVIVCGPTTIAGLRYVLMALPLSLRGRLDISTGVKFSPTRQIHLTWISCDPDETRRTARRHGLDWLDCNVPAPRQSTPFDPWLDLIRDRYQHNRLDQLYRLTRRLNVETQPEVLNYIASICRDMDRIESADQALLEDLVNKYSQHTQADEAQASLVRQLMSAAVRRSSTIRQAETSFKPHAD